LHLGTAALLDFHARHHDDEALVLATIVSTQGSTYRKPGAMMLIAADDSYEGLISGGCLEGDLLEHASGVFEDGIPKSVVYDMHSDEDLVWGLGIGCDGAIELLLVRLQREFHQSLLNGIARSLSLRQRVLFSLLTASENSEWHKGSIATVDEEGGRIGDQRLASLTAKKIQSGWPYERYIREKGTDTEAMMINLVPKPRILLCGGGPDARPMALQAETLGWDCLVADHRAAYANPDRFAAATKVILCRPESISERIDLSEIDAAVIMSHHLESDAAYLRQLAPQVASGSLSYLGVLGPVARRNRLREMAECPDVLVHGPVGLDIGAELPEAIALAVAAEIHAVLNDRDGQSLTTGPVGDGA
jgi:xanthine/CO dehydrogenase XdhC/CoxF family maturation factor